MKNNILAFGFIIAIIVGLLFSFFENFTNAIPYLIGIILYGSFLSIDLKLKNFMRKELLYYPLVMYGLIPLAIFLITLPLDPKIRIGLFIMAITPTAIASPIINEMIGGKKELLVTIIMLSNIIAPFSYSVLLLIYFKSSFTISISSLLLKMSLIIFIPFFAAMLGRRFSKLRDSSKSVIDAASPYVLFLIIAIAVSTASKQLWGNSIIDIGISLLYVIILLGILFGLGFFFSDNITTKKTLAGSFCHKNGSIAIFVTLSSFPIQSIVPVVLYIICHNFINFYLVRRYYGNN